MSVPCPGCGRDYPAERFPDGRALRCACGERVARLLRTGIAQRSGRPRFFADSMLGGLARWLRAAGYDAAWEPRIADADLVRRARDERRLVLTRDRGLAREWETDHLLLLESEGPLAQLREVFERLGVRPAEELFTRCTRCNLPLRPADPDAVASRAPAGLRERRVEVRQCEACERLYWEGSHTRRMRRALREASAGAVTRSPEDADVLGDS